MSHGLSDRFGLELTTAKAAAVEPYVAGVDRLLANESGAVELLDRAVAADPEFALAHLALSVAYREQRNATLANRHGELARVGAATVSPRERQHIAACLALAAGADQQATRDMVAHLREYPTDALVFDHLQRHWFFHGGMGRQQSILALLAELAPRFGDDWYFAGKSAFHLQEAGRLAEAQELAERSLAQRPRNASAVHALIHIAHAQRDHDRGSAALRSWLADLSPGTLLHGHLWWHVALSELAGHRVGSARQIYESAVRPARSSGTRQLALADGVGLLWGWQTLGGEGAPPWDEVLTLARELAAAPGKPFVDLHLAVAFLAARDQDALAQLMQKLSRMATTAAREVSLPVVEAVALILRDPSAASARLRSLHADEPALLDAIGGSNIERALLAEVAHYAASLAPAGDSTWVVPLSAPNGAGHPVLDHLFSHLSAG